MGKQTWKAGTFVYPIPAVLVSCGDEKEKNVLTIAWTGTICTDPAMTYISVRKERYSYDIIKRTGEFCINLTNEELAYATDFCGVKSGKNIDKFKEMNLTPERATFIKAPMIKESPVSIECRVKEIKELGSHDMFIAEVLAINVDEKYMDETGRFDMQKCKLIAYSHGQYYKLGEKIGKFGYSVKKK
ncbi:MAG: flavin reductase family protein [Clostridia bacterium]|nr:flavin reductase family protein [Clostridia bacterium]